MMNVRTFVLAVVAACAITLMAGCSQQAVSGSAPTGANGAASATSSASADSASGASGTSSVASPASATSVGGTGSAASANSSGGTASVGGTGSATSSTSSASASSAGAAAYVLDGDIMAEIRLDYNAGTGFEWQCAVEPEGVIGIVSQETRSLDDDELLAGGPLQDVVVIASQAPGQAIVTCSLVRPWETDSEPAEVQTFVYEVDGTSQLHFKADESSFTNAPEMIALS